MLKTALTSVITKEQNSESGSTVLGDQPENEPRAMTLRDIPELVIAAGAVVLTATLFAWLLFSF